MIKRLFCIFLIGFLMATSANVGFSENLSAGHDGGDFILRGEIQKIRPRYIEISNKKIYTKYASWLDTDDQNVSSSIFKVGDLVEIEGCREKIVWYAETISSIKNLDEDIRKVALLFVGHGEPATSANGDLSITFPDGEPFGPHATSLGVPVEAQYTEWAAAYEEIATAMTISIFAISSNMTPSAT